MKTDACDASQLDAFLTGQMTELQEAKLTDHLDHCFDCGSELLRRAADAAAWREVRSLLAQPTASGPGQAPDDRRETPITVRQVLDLLAPTDDPASLGRLDGFEILGVVGYGAMGVVLKAEDRSLDRIVALKVMNPSLAASGVARQRFAREARAAAGILHANVIAIHGVSSSHALPYLVMPYLKGPSLQQRVDREGPLAVPEILRIGSQLAAGLAAAHQQGLIHRDIKPSNIMLDEGVETVVITDFGLARTIDDATMTRSGSITGTPEFMSPEQTRGEAVDSASDLFSLGSVLHTLCTGRSPFRAQTTFGVMRRITEGQSPPIRDINPQIPLWLCQIIRNLHTQSPAQRPTAEQTRRLLGSCLAHVYQPDRFPLPESLNPLPALSHRRLSKPLFPGVLMMTVLSVICLLAFSFGALPFSTPGQDGLVNSADPVVPLQEEELTIYQTLTLDFPQPDQTGSLVIDINRGFVEVVAHDEPAVVIEILNPPGMDHSGKQQDGWQQQFAPQFDLDTDPTANQIKLDTYNQNYVLNLRVKVPRRTNLSLDTYYDGYLQVQDVVGTVVAHSQNCDIRLLNISGSAAASSYNGDFTISFREVATDAKLDFESYNGSIDLSLPAEIQATTAIAAGRGSYRSMFEIQSVSEDNAATARLFGDLKNKESYRWGTIGGGGIPLRMESEKGPITIRKRNGDRSNKNP